MVLAARLIVRQFSLPAVASVRLGAGFLGLGLLLAAELSLALVLQDQSLGQYIASRDPVSGSVYLALLALFLAPRTLHEAHNPARHSSALA